MPKSYKTLLFFVFSVVMMVSCSPSDPIMQDIQRQGKLVVLTRNAPSTYFYGADDSPVGFEYDLTKALADSLNVEVEYKVFDNIEAILNAINQGEGHVAAAGLTLTEKRSDNYNFGPSYKSIQQQVVCHRSAQTPKNISELQQHSLLIIAESSYQDSLETIQETYPELKWQNSNDLSSEQILNKVANKEVDCTVVDSNIISLNRRYYPDLMVAFAISDQQQLAWLLPHEADAFNEYLSDWFEKIENNATLDMINERYYGYDDIFDYYDNQVFQQRIDKRLPKYQSLF